MSGFGKAAAAIAVTTLLSSGCAANGLDSLPLPAPTLGSGGYTLTAVFADALNLPMNAKVKLAGADVGQVESMVARNYTAVTRLRITDDVRLPRGSTAELRTATPLGDVFVALRPPAGAGTEAAMLKDGDTIGLDSTTAAATVESVLSSAAILVNGGAIRNFTNMINGFGNATGDQGQAFGNLIRKSNRLLATLDSRSEQISTGLSELASLAEQLDAKNQAVTELMAAAEPAADALAANTGELSNLVVQVGDTTRLLARFPALGGTDTSWLALNRMIPPMVKSTARGALSVRASVDRLVLGSIPDIGFPGDVGLHGPHRYNWNQFIGSLKYTLWRLQERVVGRGPGSPQLPVMPDPEVPDEIQIAPPLSPQPPGPPP